MQQNMPSRLLEILVRDCSIMPHPVYYDSSTFIVLRKLSMN